MSLTVAELVAKVSADTSSFESGMHRVQSSMSGASGAVGKTESAFASFARTAGAFVAGQIIYKGLTLATHAVVEFGKNVILTKARVDEMTIVLQNLARVNGVAQATVDQQVNGIRALHIEYGVAQNTVAQMIRSQIDVAKATDLARVAQDAAVISGQNSSDVLQQLIYGITTRQTEMLRTAGIQVNIDAAERAYAASLGKTVTQLSEQEKTQATLNAVLQEGAKYQGTYETAMQSAGKQMRSIKTDMDNLMVTMGGPFQAGFGSIIKGVRSTIAEVTKGFGAGGQFEAALNQMGAAFSKIGASFGPFLQSAVAGLIPAITPLVTQIGNIASKLMEVFGPVIARLGPIIGQLIDVVGPVITRLAELFGPVIGDALVTFANLLLMVARAAAPVVNALAPVVAIIGQALVDAFNALMPALGPALQILGGAFADVIKALQPALPPLAKALVELVKAASPLIVVWAKTFADAMKQIGPQLPAIVKGLAQLLVALLPLLPPFIQLVRIALIPTMIFMREMGLGAFVLGHALQILATVVRFVIGHIQDFGKAFIDWLTLRPLLEGIANMLPGVLSAFGNFATSIGAWFAGLPGIIARSLETFVTQMVPAGARALGGFLLGLLQALPQVIEFFLLLPFRLVGIIVWGNIMVAKGVEMLAGFLVGLVKKLPEIAVWLASLPGKFLVWLGNTLATLIPKGWDLLVGFYTGMVRKVGDLQAWLASLPGKAAGWVGNTLGHLLSKGWDLLVGFGQGMVNKVGDLKNWLGGLPGQLASAIGYLGGWLVGAGMDLLQGLWDGLIEKGNQVLGWLGDFASKAWRKITHPWELFSPSHAMMRVGRQIMQGMAIGLQQGSSDVFSALNAFGPRMQRAMPVLGASVTSLSAGAGAGAGGVSAPVVVNINVAGSVLSERELGDVVNEQLWRLQRNAVATPWGRSA